MTHNETKVLRWKSVHCRADGMQWPGEIDIDEFTQYIFPAISIEEKTLASTLTKLGILRVTTSGIYLTQVIFRHVSPQERIVLAAIEENEIVLVMYHESGRWSLLNLQIIENGQDVISEGEEISLPLEPTSIKLVVSSQRTPALTGLLQSSKEGGFQSYCFLGFRFGKKMFIYGLSSPSPPSLVHEFSIEENVNEMIDESRISDIHCMETLIHKDQAYLLWGMRHGVIITYKLQFSNNQWTFSDPKSTKLGDSHIDFISGPYRRDEDKLFVACEYLWEIHLLNGELQINEVLFDDFRVVILPSIGVLELIC